MPEVTTEKQSDAEKIVKGDIQKIEELQATFHRIYSEWYAKTDTASRPIHLKYAGMLKDTYDTLTKLGYKSLEQLGLKIGKSKTWLSRVFKVVSDKEKRDRYLKGHIDLLGNEPKDTLTKTKAKIAFKELREESGSKDYVATPQEIAGRAEITEDQAKAYLNSRLGVNPSEKVINGINLILKGLNSKQSSKVYSLSLKTLKEGVEELNKVADVYRTLKPLFKK